MIQRLRPLRWACFSTESSVVPYRRRAVFIEIAGEPEMSGNLGDLPSAKAVSFLV
jgi:hypothetical protein